MILVDTNILIHAANASSPDHKACVDLLDSLRQGHAPWHLTWGNLYEFLRFTTHLRIMNPPLEPKNAWLFINKLLSSDSCSLLQETGSHLINLEAILIESAPCRGNFMFDARTASIMREHGIRKIYTLDTGFHRFKGIEVIDPLN